MKKVIYIAIISMIFLSCHHKNNVKHLETIPEDILPKRFGDVTCKQISTNQPVYIVLYADGGSDDAKWFLSIPLEYKLDVSFSDFKRLAFYLTRDGKYYDSNNRDFLVFKTKNNKYIYNEVQLGKLDYIENIYMRHKYPIDKKSVEKYVEKYGLQNVLKEIKKNDTLKLASYENFRNDFPKTIEIFEKQKDTLEVAVHYDNHFKIYKQKINW